MIDGKKGKTMTKKILPLVLCVLLSGCYVQSINKFYTDDLKVDLPLIEGEWSSVVQIGENVSGQKIFPWEFLKDKVKTYDADNNFAELEVAYFKIGDDLFMDFTAGEPRDGVNLFWGAGVTLTHSLCKVILREDELVLIPMDIEWFEKKIKQKDLIFSFVKADKNSNYIFTATPGQWVAFLRAHANDKGVFNEKYRFVFKKKVSVSENMLKQRLKEGPVVFGEFAEGLGLSKEKMILKRLWKRPQGFSAEELLEHRDRVLWTAADFLDQKLGTSRGAIRYISIFNTRYSLVMINGNFTGYIKYNGYPGELWEVTSLGKRVQETAQVSIEDQKAIFHLPCGDCTHSIALDFSDHNVGLKLERHFEAMGGP